MRCVHNVNGVVWTANAKENVCGKIHLLEFEVRLYSCRSENISFLGLATPNFRGGVA